MANGNLRHAVEHNQWLITLAAIGIFLGAVGKSAQFPLHVWLPDAMEGPTPVSALIHAATMVAAGVYMLARSHFLIAASGTAETLIAWTGGITALLAALMATQQNDIKKILAYSTLSQLGYMVMAVGLSAPDAGMFHLYTHAFFKALLFLGAGAVIHACHHQQDIWKMGGLRDKMPATFYTFAAGTAALMGVPLTSGFFSKENILGAAYAHNTLLFLIGVTTAGLTAFYMTRLVIVVFTGKAKSDEAGHAHEVSLVMLVPLALLAVPSLVSAYGFLAGPLQAMVPHAEHEGANVVKICSVAVLIIGFLAGAKLYRNAEKDPVNIPLFANKFYFDEIYAVIVKFAQDRLAWIVNALEKMFVDSSTTRLPAAIASGLGGFFRRLQSGNLQSYTFVFGAGVIIAVYLAVFLSSKH
jgi:NADH-quinone oxidoreductase subunit L